MTKTCSACLGRGTYMMGEPNTLRVVACPACAGTGHVADPDQILAALAADPALPQNLSAVACAHPEPQPWRTATNGVAMHTEPSAETDEPLFPDVPKNFEWRPVGDGYWALFYFGGECFGSQVKPDDIAGIERVMREHIESNADALYLPDDLRASLHVATDTLLEGNPVLFDAWLKAWLMARSGGSGLAGLVWYHTAAHLTGLNPVDVPMRLRVAVKHAVWFLVYTPEPEVEASTLALGEGAAPPFRATPHNVVREILGALRREV